MMNDITDGTFKRIGRNQYEMRRDIEQVRPPSFTLDLMRNFNLAEIPTYFEIADFERAKSSFHINEIKIAILNNQFYDVVIRVVVRNRKLIVIDGQHRLAALYILHKDHGLQTYDLVIMKYEEDAQRTVYRKLNVGKVLKLSNHLKALDNGRVQFFNDLRSLLCHDDRTKLWTFKEALECQVYSDSGQFLSSRRLDSQLFEIDEKDTTYLKKFAECLILTSPTRTRGMQFKQLFQVNAYAIAYHHNMNKAEINKLIMAGLKTPEIIEQIGVIQNAEGRKRVAEHFKRLGDEIMNG